jgi:hypothetical protein
LVDENNDYANSILPLATLDNRLAEAAIRCGVSLIIDKE